MGNSAPCCTDESITATPVETAVASNTTEEKPAPAEVEVPLVITFDVMDGTTRNMTFTEKPLGLDFSLRLPMSVKRIKENSHGSELGVQLGWTILQIDGEDLPDNFDAALQMIHQKLLRLKEGSRRQ
eukprot:TRINITY_DN106512_c0_g1_i1.p1 TRINITY_DN106512_c0_g1~~TRINITY_DN106512_c0_g1_i1.p1  ORF type:complete len:127 (+),score=29.11 TRINITY_DN106512_c0_g1_i1:60-440(+)